MGLYVIRDMKRTTDLGVIPVHMDTQLDPWNYIYRTTQRSGPMLRAADNAWDIIRAWFSENVMTVSISDVVSVFLCTTITSDEFLWLHCRACGQVAGGRFGVGGATSCS